MIGTSPNNLSASFNGLNCFLKSSNPYASLNTGPLIVAICANGSLIADSTYSRSSLDKFLFLGSSFRADSNFLTKLTIVYFSFLPFALILGNLTIINF